VVIGPESTGKSSLCAQLAKHYKTIWVNEYAREFLLINGTDYSFDDLLHIAKKQVAKEDTEIENFKKALGYDDRFQESQGNLPVFIDTDMYVMKVWCEFVFGKCHPWILDRVVERKYDLYLLCNVDVPWVKDVLREYPDLSTRERLYHHYKDTMINQSVQWIDISGNYDERLRTAIREVDKLLH
jgi:NadR type nicotinamide-nucleotide adenylyltransferase